MVRCGLPSKVLKQRKVQPIDVAVHDIEVGGRLGNRIELHSISRERVRPRPAEADAREEPWKRAYRGERISACEQRDVMTSATSSSVSQETTRSVPP